MASIKYLILIIILFVICPSNIRAAFSISTPQTTISPQEEIDLSVDLTLQGQYNKTYYLEGAFKKIDANSYFGLTYNGSEWAKYTSSLFTTLLAIKTDQEGKWSGVVKVKIDPESQLYKGDGTYKLQMKRFTSAGSSTWSDNELAITIKEPPLTPTLSPTQSPTSISPQATQSVASSLTPTTTPEPSIEPPITEGTVSPSPIQTLTPTPKTPEKFIISSKSSNLQKTDSVLAEVQIEGLDREKPYYLKGAFFKDNSINYFGFTKMAGSWIKNSQPFSSQLLIKTDSLGLWSGTIETKVDDEDSGYKDIGDYSFKVGRYSFDGAGPTWSNKINLSITDTPKITSVVTANTPTPTKTISPTSNISTTIHLLDKPAKSPSITVYKAKKVPSSILGIAIATSSSEKHFSSPSALLVKTQERHSNIPLFISYILLGGSLTGFAYLLIKNYHRLGYELYIRYIKRY